MKLAWPDRLIEAGALFLLVFTPLAFGTVHPWSEAVAELVILGMAVTYVTGTLRHWELRVELPPGWLPALLFLMFAVLQAIVPGWSLDPHATWRQALKLLAVAAFFLICWNTYRTRDQVRRALWTMIGTGAFLALFAIVQRMTWNGHLYWIGPELSHGNPFGPFVNRAHFAGLMVIIIPLALAYILSRQRQTPSRTRLRMTWQDRLREWNSRDENPGGLLLLLILVMGAATLFSGSRGGVVALLAALVAMMVGSLADDHSWNRRVARITMVAVLIVLTSIWLSSEVLYGTIERLTWELGRPGESWRVRIWTDALALWSSAPTFGTGLATFAAAFPRYRTIEAPSTFTHAESDWVQLFTDTGLAGMIAGLGAVTMLSASLANKYGNSTFKRDRSFVLAGLVALGGTVIQGSVNYGLPVTANLFYVAAAVVLVVRWTCCPKAVVVRPREK